MTGCIRHCAKGKGEREEALRLLHFNHVSFLIAPRTFTRPFFLLPYADSKRVGRQAHACSIEKFVRECCIISDECAPACVFVMWLEFI
mmetsp:Transcript_22816/g.44945  ORF Transcript_22816/g.44945 Transcript_22816/m.44945 type:complete len:88 (+) Transcript_22816:1038-1301(+)